MAKTELELAVEAAVKAATEGLVSKNTELLGKLKTANEGLVKIEGLDIAALTSASEELAKLKADKLEADGEYKKMYDQQKIDNKTTIDKLTLSNTELVTNLANSTKTNALSTALLGSKIKPELHDVAVATLLDKVAVGKDGVPVVGDKSVVDYVKDWATTDVGKHFIISGKSGGGGDGSEDGNLDASEKFFDKKNAAYNLTEQSKIATSNPDQYKALKAKFN